MSMNTVYTTFSKDLENYLRDKLSDIPPHVAQEIGTHIGYKVMVLVYDMIREYDRDLKFQMSKNSRRRNHYGAEEEEK